MSRAWTARLRRLRRERLTDESRVLMAANNRVEIY